jgi:hypothetical protein
MRAGDPIATEKGDILRHDAPSTDGTTISYCDTRQDGSLPADPTVVPNRDRLCKLDAVPSRLNLRHVGRSKYAYIWAKEDSIANSDETAVQNHCTNSTFQLEIHCLNKQGRFTHLKLA